jgi:hypothetical protein
VHYPFSPPPFIAILVIRLPCSMEQQAPYKPRQISAHPEVKHLPTMPLARSLIAPVASSALSAVSGLIVREKSVLDHLV